MNHFILSAAHQYFTGDWNEESPKWSSQADEGYQFAGKEDALATMRRHIEADQTAERVPGFAGCRAASVVSDVLRTLKKRGHAVKADGADVTITVEPEDGQRAKKTLPLTLLGVRINLRTTLGQVLR
jgi:hypothetical protein